MGDDKSAQGLFGAGSEVVWVADGRRRGLGMLGRDGRLKSEGRLTGSMVCHCTDCITTDCSEIIREKSICTTGYPQDS